jgi:hypothetical protein
MQTRRTCGSVLTFRLKTDFGATLSLYPQKVSVTRSGFKKDSFQRQRGQEFHRTKESRWHTTTRICHW